MPKAKDLTGKTFGKLTVVSYIGSRMYAGKMRRFYLSKCDCGGEIELPGDSMKSGKTSSCGCLRWQMGPHSPKWGGHGEISGNYWDHISRGAAKRKYLFDITLKESWDLFLKQNRKCALSGLTLSFGIAKDEIRTASLDRINSKLGYISGNVQWVHKDINRMKQHFEESWFLSLCKTVTDYHKGDCDVFE